MTGLGSRKSGKEGSEVMSVGVVLVRGGLRDVNE